MSASISMDLFSVASLRFKAFSSSSSTSMSSFAALSFKSTIRSLSSRSDEANFFERSSACKCLCIAVLVEFILRVAVSSSRMDALTSRVFSSNAGFSRWRIFAFASSHFLSTSFNVFKDSFSRVSESTENDFSLVHGFALLAFCHPRFALLSRLVRLRFLLFAFFIQSFQYFLSFFLFFFDRSYFSY